MSSTERHDSSCVDAERKSPRLGLNCPSPWSPTLLRLSDSVCLSASLLRSVYVFHCVCVCVCPSLSVYVFHSLCLHHPLSTPLRRLFSRAFPRHRICLRTETFKLGRVGSSSSSASSRFVHSSYLRACCVAAPIHETRALPLSGPRPPPPSFPPTRTPIVHVSSHRFVVAGGVGL